jgi:hypothetical protein
MLAAPDWRAGDETMARMTFPWGGDVSQAFRLMFAPRGNVFSFLNFDFGKTPDPDVEREIVDDVGSYGRQLGRIGDALAVLIEHFEPKRELTRAEARAIDDLRRMQEEIVAVKRRAAERR